MSYELQVHALSPIRPTVAELLARAAESGLGVELAGPADAPADSREWTRLCLRAVGEAEAFTLEASGETERMKALFREDAESGDLVPDQVLDAVALYVLELAEGSAGEDESQEAAFVIAAWALASLVEGIVFDPQEEFFADAESFWALVMDEAAGEPAVAAPGDPGDGGGRVDG